MKSFYPNLEEYKEKIESLSRGEPTETEKSEKSTKAEPIIHTVSEFDTLDSISFRYGVSKDAIRMANGFSDDFIYQFKTLQIPFSKGEIAFRTTPPDYESLRKREYFL